MHSNTPLDYTMLINMLLQSALDAAIMIDQDGHVVAWNPVAEQIFGHSHADVIGQPLGELIIPPQHKEAYCKEVTQYLDTGVSHDNQHFYFKLQRRSGEGFPCEFTIHPIFLDNGKYFTIYVRDLSKQIKTQARQEALYAIIRSLQEVTEPQEVVEVILREVIPITGAVRGHVGVITPDHENLKFLGDLNYSEEIKTQLAKIPLSLDHPATYVARTGKPVFGTHEMLYAQFSALAYFNPSGTVTRGVLPLTVQGHTFGQLMLIYDTPQAFDEAEQEFLMAVAEQCAMVLNRTQLLEAERLTRTQLAFLAQAGELLASSLDLDVTLIHLANLAVPHIADWCAIYLPKGPYLVPVGLAHSDPEKVNMLRSYVEELPVEIDGPSGTAQIYHTGTPSYVPTVTPAMLDALDISDEQRARAHSLNLRSFIGVPIVAHERITGVMSFALAETERNFTPEDLNLALELGRRAGLALEQAHLFQQLQESYDLLEIRVQERTQALDAFVAYTTAVGTQTDVLTLAREALTVLKTRFVDASAAYYELEGDLWKAKAWTEDMPEDTIAALQAGIPTTLPLFSQAAQSPAGVFVDGWDPEQQQAEQTTTNYGAGSAYPLTVGDKLTGLLAVGLRNTQTWSKHDKALVQAVGRSLNLALERADQALRLVVQNAELEARTKALESFSELTRNLSVQSDPHKLIKRAQEVIHSMLPDGYSVYYELRDSIWYPTIQTGDRRNPQLQAIVEAGIPYELTDTLVVPWTTKQPFYQDSYVLNTDEFKDLTKHISSTAAFPVQVDGEPVGVLLVVIFEVHSWTGADRAVLEAVAVSLSMALERAKSVKQLAITNKELERSNTELEQFAHIASHDLQAPLRTITSFAELLKRGHSGPLDERAGTYLKQIIDSSTHMKRLVDDLLAFSKVNSQQKPLQRIDSEIIFTTVLQRLSVEFEAIGGQVTHDLLPMVLADPIQLDSLLQNLIGNGLKYHRQDVPPNVHVSAERDGPVWRFSVADNGIGIEQAYFERVFEIFQRLHTRNEYEGTGIGLAICKKIVERHGGKLWLTSTPGKGTTFYFTLLSV